jgi:hypothetical protein
MEVQTIGFIPPVEGVENAFNTFRLGWTLANRLTVGQEVLLLDEKTKIVFGRAQVVSVHKGNLIDMCREHAWRNHRELRNEPDSAPDRLIAYIRKLFGPHIAVDNKRCTVIYLKRLE